MVQYCYWSTTKNDGGSNSNNNRGHVRVYEYKIQVHLNGI